MEPVIAEIRLFAGNFAPRSWAFCNGELLSISQYQALFSLLGTTYGGDGRTTFALPDLRGRVPLQQGNGPGLQPIRLGQQLGTNANVLSLSQMPSHKHGATARLRATDSKADTRDPSNAALSKDRGTATYQTEAPANVNMKADSIQTSVGYVGASAPVPNQQPSLGMNYIICLQGLFPSRS
jgi:microcystin-dependent protein